MGHYGLVTVATELDIRPLSPIIGAELWAGPIFAAIDGEHRDVFYENLRRPVWRGES